MPAQPEQAEALRTEIDRARSLFGLHRIRPDHVLVDQTVVRFLWWAIADADLIILAVEHEQTAALSPVLRHLFETTHDVMHFVGVAEDLEEVAAGSLVGELLDWHKQVWRRDDVVRQASRLAAGQGDRKMPPTVDEAFEQVAEKVEGLGQDTTVLRRVYEENRERTHSARGVHCTGFDRVSLIHQARRKFADGGEDIKDILAVCNQLEWLWRETSARGRTHSSPGWLTLSIEQDEATGRLDDDPTVPHLEKVTSVAASMLLILNDFVGQYFEDRDDEE